MAGSAKSEIHERNESVVILSEAKDLKPAYVSFFEILRFAQDDISPIERFDIRISKLNSLHAQLR
jgi:hypothetical protein